MKLLQFNILEGCRNDEARLKKIGNWIKENSYDIVGLNEAPSAIDQIGREWGYQYSQIAIAEGREYYVAILSKYPIRLLDMYSTVFHHSMMHVKIIDKNFMVTHLEPNDSLLREKETLLIKDLVMKVNNPLMLMGDLNSLSPLDRRRHEQDNVKAFLQSSNLLRKKFLNPEGDINYRPLEHLLEAGMIDVFNRLDAGTYTVPTQFNKDKAHATRMRLDYILINRPFSGDFRVRVIKDRATNFLSDHYPLECMWNLMQETS